MLVAQASRGRQTKAEEGTEVETESDATWRDPVTVSFTFVFGSTVVLLSAA